MALNASGFAAWFQSLFRGTSMVSAPAMVFVHARVFAPSLFERALAE
jgi:hypothetical protein